MTQININVSQQDDIAILKTDGFMSMTEVFSFENTLTSLIESGQTKIILDFSALNYISSAGLGAIMGAIKNVQRRQGDIKIAGMMPAVFEIFDTFGFTQIFKIYSSVAEATAAFKG